MTSGAIPRPASIRTNERHLDSPPGSRASRRGSPSRSTFERRLLPANAKSLGPHAPSIASRSRSSNPPRPLGGGDRCDRRPRAGGDRRCPGAGEPGIGRTRSLVLHVASPSTRRLSTGASRARLAIRREHGHRASRPLALRVWPPLREERSCVRLHRQRAAKEVPRPARGREQLEEARCPSQGIRREVRASPQVRPRFVCRCTARLREGLHHGPFLQRAEAPSIEERRILSRGAVASRSRPRERRREKSIRDAAHTVTRASEVERMPPRREENARTPRAPRDTEARTAA